VADEGRWRPPPADPGFRGRGLTLLRELSTSVRLDRRPDGTVVTFVLTLRSTGGALPSDGAVPEDRPARVTVTVRDGDRCAELTGDLDLAGVAAVRGSLLAAVAAPGPMALDLRSLDSLSSSGLGLLLEAARARPADLPVEVLLPEAGPVRRLLDLTGLADALRRRG
jgi:anti-anti-sigma factor